MRSLAGRHLPHLSPSFFHCPKAPFGIVFLALTLCFKRAGLESDGKLSPRLFQSVNKGLPDGFVSSILPHVCGVNFPESSAGWSVIFSGHVRGGHHDDHTTPRQSDRPRGQPVHRHIDDYSSQWIDSDARDGRCKCCLYRDDDLVRLPGIGITRSGRRPALTRLRPGRDRPGQAPGFHFRCMCAGRLAGMRRWLLPWPAASARLVPVGLPGRCRNKPSPR